MRKHNVKFVRDDGMQFVEGDDGLFRMVGTNMSPPYAYDISVFRAIIENNPSVFTEVNVPGPNPFDMFTVTDSMLDDVCMSYSHDYGLLAEEDQAVQKYRAEEWLKAWAKNPDFIKFVRSIGVAR